MSQYKQVILFNSVFSTLLSWIDMFYIKSGGWLSTEILCYMGVISPIICLFVIFVLPKMKIFKSFHLPDDCKDKTTLIVILTGFVLSIYPCVVLALNGVML